MKLRVELDSEEYTLDLRPNSARSEYTLCGAINASGAASVIEVMPGVFSVLLAHRSFTIYLAPKGDELEVWVGTERHTVSVADARDRPGKSKRISAAGPMQIRAQMPGRVIKLLAGVGAGVTAGQGLIVMEAMKMQNEMKSPKDGIVTNILVGEGATVVAGETLIVVE